MTQIVTAHFDGKVIVPDEPVQLPVGAPLRIAVELQELGQVVDKVQKQDSEAASEPRFAGLLSLAADLPDAPPDLAAQHDHYLYGSPKR
jgi:hypothetical protein